MPDVADPPTEPDERLTAGELAALVGGSAERVDELTARGVLIAGADGRYDPGDAHRVRVVEGFEAAGVPLDVLVRAQDAGVISVAYYDDLHGPPGHPSPRTFEAFTTSLGPTGELVPALLAAFGMAEPEPSSRLSVEDETFIGNLAALFEASGHVDLALRIARQFGEATRRASAAALDVYAELIERLEPEFAGVPSREVYEQHFLPWAKLARSAPALAAWLTSHHISRAIDEYSIGSTEQMLADSGFVAQRPAVEPAVAFLDLTGFTTLTQKQGDAVAAELALKLAELAARVAEANGGRVVKLLGDGVLMRFRSADEAVDASLELLDRLGPAGLPAGHVGVSEGPLIARDGDIFGRTVNLAARLSDVAPSGELYVPAATGASLAGRFVVEPVGPRDLQGIGPVEAARVARRSDTSQS